MQPKAMPPVGTQICSTRPSPSGWRWTVPGCEWKGVHSTHRGGSSVSDSQKRSSHTPHLAPATGPGAGAHPGVFSGVCALEDAGADVSSRRSGTGAATGIGGTVEDQGGGRSHADTRRHRDSQAVHHATDRTPVDTASAAWSAPAEIDRNDGNVVKTFKVRPLLSHSLRQ